MTVSTLRLVDNLYHQFLQYSITASVREYIGDTLKVRQWREREREREREMTTVQLIHQHLTCTHSSTETYEYFSSYRNVGINCVT